jgi:hypothetical protein
MIQNTCNVRRVKLEAGQLITLKFPEIFSCRALLGSPVKLVRRESGTKSRVTESIFNISLGNYYLEEALLKKVEVLV